MRRLSAWSGALVTAAAALALAAPAGASTLPVAKARAAAAKRLFAYVWPLSYVTDYRLTSCARTSRSSVACGYRVAFHGGEPCAGTILVGHAGRSVTSRFAGGLCTPPDAPPAEAPPPPTVVAPPPATDPAQTTPAETATIPIDTTPATPTTPAAPAYAGVGSVHSLDSVDGDVVKLDDGSEWRVSDGVTGWMYDDAIDVAYANGAYTLTDDNADGDPVAATYLG